jgi:site-specific recombinase XerD
MDTSYCEDKEKLLAIIYSWGYSTYMLDRYILYFRQLEEFTETNHRGIYSQQVGLSWVHKTEVLNKIRYRNRIVEMLSDIRAGRPIQPGGRYYLNPSNLACPERHLGLLNGYLTRIGKYGHCETTIKRVRKTLVCFLQYVEGLGICELSGINHSIMNRFITEALNGYSLGTKENHLSDIRGFFGYLAELGTIPERNISYCPSITCIPEKIPSILSEETQEVLQNLEEPNSEIAARDNAILLLTYRLGLRRSDAFNLKFSEIDWKNKKIRIVQKKTLVPLELPLPDDVGDALSNYICNFRKDVEDHCFVFLTVKPPIRRIKPGAGGATAERLHKKYGVQEEFHGLHILRRTCASKILNFGNTPEMVAAVLGHSNMDSIRHYIALDNDKMQCCAMSISLVGFPEVLNDRIR